MSTKRIDSRSWQISADGTNIIDAAGMHIASVGNRAEAERTLARIAELEAELGRRLEVVAEGANFQNNLAAVLGVQTDWDAAGRKAVVDAACRLVGNLADAQRRVAELEEGLAQTEQVLTDTEQDRNALATRVADLAAERVNLAARVAELKAKLEIAKQREERYRAEAVLLRADRDALTAQLGELKEELTEARRHGKCGVSAPGDDSSYCQLTPRHPGDLHSDLAGNQWCLTAGCPQHDETVPPGLPVAVTFTDTEGESAHLMTDEEYHAWEAAVLESRVEGSASAQLLQQGREQAARRLGILEGSATWRMMTAPDSTLDRAGQLPADTCCDMHNSHCEPPGDLCCWRCTEADHPRHPPGVQCTWITPPADTTQEA